MKIQFLSDLHREFYPGGKGSSPKIFYNADVVILGGDISTTPEGAAHYIKSIRGQTKGDILYIPGNHEYYGHEFPADRESYRSAVEAIPGVNLIDRSYYRDDDNKIIILCTTLWTDFDSHRGIGAATQGLNDLRLIRIDNSYDSITAYDLIEEHEKDKVWLVDQLRDFEDYTMIVATHHAPSIKSIHPQYHKDPLNSCFFADLENIIARYEPKYWFHGHTHHACEYKLGETTVICNPVGYPQERDTGYRDLLVEV